MKKDYHINIFYSEEDEGYIADIPDLVHCSVFGNTPEEALSEALVPRKHGLKLPAPRGNPSPHRGVALSFIK